MDDSAIAAAYSSQNSQQEPYVHPMYRPTNTITPERQRRPRTPLQGGHRNSYSKTNTLHGISEGGEDSAMAAHYLLTQPGQGGTHLDYPGTSSYYDDDGSYGSPSQYQQQQQANQQQHYQQSYQQQQQHYPPLQNQQQGRQQFNLTTRTTMAKESSYR